jgi:hypothetical protein
MNKQTCLNNSIPWILENTVVIPEWRGEQNQLSLPHLSHWPFVYLPLPLSTQICELPNHESWHKYYFHLTTFTEWDFLLFVWHYEFFNRLTFFCENHSVGNVFNTGMGLPITIDKLRVFINKTLSILSVYQLDLNNRPCLSAVGW